jgi:hypothetical protein
MAQGSSCLALSLKAIEAFPFHPGREKKKIQTILSILSKKEEAKFGPF